MEVKNSKPYLIRRARQKDIPFITNSWLKSQRGAPGDDGWTSGCPDRVYYFYQHRIIDQLIPRSIVLVAVNEDDPDQILGWMAAEVVDTALVIHYVYVKHPFRRVGVAKTLLQTMVATEKPPVVMYTTKTHVLKRIKPWKLGMIYNPYLVWVSLPNDWEREGRDAVQED